MSEDEESDASTMVEEMEVAKAATEVADEVEDVALIVTV